MTLTPQQKDEIKRELRECLCGEPEISRIVVFGSFLTSNSPQDLDLAIFQNSTEKYLPLAIKYRRRIRRITDKIPVDVFPLRPDPAPSPFLREIEQGELIYEK